MTSRPTPGGVRSPWPLLLVGALGGALVAGLALSLLSSAPVAPAGAQAGGAPDGGDAAAAGFGPAPVDVVRAIEIVAAEPVELLGSVAPVRESLVASEVDGLVAEVHADEGETVREGQVLVRLRTVNVEQELAAARAARDETEARLARAQADYERVASLLDREAVSQREYDQAIADRDALRQAVVRQNADIAVLEDRLARAEVRAPYTGQVAAVSIEVGEWVGRGDPILTLVDLSEVEIEVPVAERYISAVPVGFRVDVRFDALPGLLRPGTVKAVVPQAVAGSRTFPVLVRVANRDGAIRAGMAARVLAQLGNPEPVTLIAKDALVRRGTQVFAYRLNPAAFAPAEGARGEPGEGAVGLVEQIGLEVGPARGQWQVVYGDIAPGDLIIVRGNERVYPGTPAQVAAVRELPEPAADPDRPIALDPEHGGTGR